MRSRVVCTQSCTVHSVCGRVLAISLFMCSCAVQLRYIGNTGLPLQVMGKLSQSYAETTVNLKGRLMQIRRPRHV